MKTVLVVEGVEREEDLSSLVAMITKTGYTVVAAEPLNECEPVKCEHDDPKCPLCKGVCTNEVYAIVGGIPMCRTCAGVALER